MIIKKSKQNSTITTLLLDKKTHLSNNPENLKFSFEDFCSKQKYSSSFSDWQKIGLLSKAMETMHGYCNSPIKYDGTKCSLYNDFPSKYDTLFDYPEHVTPDASWVRIHVNGPAVIVGHIIQNTFFVVFLDKTHKFYLTKKTRQQYFGKKANKPENRSK
ncbi:hypothetical protein [Polaribacter sp. IC063]|uniref:hypothetical protein n=1 Tax=Polaribacter sp. IC063 TaxID=57031 RepID=UPI0011BF38CD|nr:hypothetical protein [Polaribacter sp. IC063]TXD48138.1 hypothetical protein ES043_18005 [Polaribacter sp. IC063]